MSDESPVDTARRWLDGEFREDEQPTETVGGTVEVAVSVEVPEDADEDALWQALIGKVSDGPWADVTGVSVDE